VSLLTTTSVRVSADTNPGNCIQIGRFMHRITSDTDLTGFTTSACVVADISFYSQGGFLVTLRRLAMGYLTSSWPSLVRSGGNLTVAEDHTPRWLVPLAYVTCAGGIITAITQMQQSPISRPFQHCRFAYDASTRTLYTPYTIATGIGLETDVIPVSTTAEIWLKPGSWMELVTSPAAPSGAGFYLVGYIKTDSDGLLDYLHDYQYRWIDDPGTS